MSNTTRRDAKHHVSRCPSRHVAFEIAPGTNVLESCFELQFSMLNNELSP